MVVVFLPEFCILFPPPRAAGAQGFFYNNDRKYKLKLGRPGLDVWTFGLLKEDFSSERTYSPDNLTALWSCGSRKLLIELHL